MEVLRIVSWFELGIIGGLLISFCVIAYTDIKDEQKNGRKTKMNKENCLNCSHFEIADNKYPCNKCTHCYNYSNKFEAIPIKTRQSEILKLCPNARVIGNPKFLNICPKLVEKDFDCNLSTTCVDCRMGYWNEVIT